MRDFDQVLKEMSELHQKKMTDYGRTHDPYANVRASEDFGIAGWVGCAIRMNDKMRRIQKFASTGELVLESVEDAFLDLAVYAIIGLCLYRETTAPEIRANNFSEAMPTNECDHMTGVTVKAGSARFVYSNSERSTTEFIFCPRCGVKLVTPTGQDL